MTRSMPRRMETLGTQGRWLAALLGRLVAGPELHVSLVIARTAKHARMRRTGFFIARAER
jgi:hypothetical protein